MARWFAAIVLGLFLIAHGVAAFAGAEGEDPGHASGSGNSGGSVDHSHSHH
jgi:hypothetical protein